MNFLDALALATAMFGLGGLFGHACARLNRPPRRRVGSSE